MQDLQVESSISLPRLLTGSISVELKPIRQGGICHTCPSIENPVVMTTLSTRYLDLK